jgi:DNA polymerase-2
MLDLYAHPQDGLVLWLLETPPDGDESEPIERRRLRLRQPFPVTFYAAGEGRRLRSLWRWLQNQSIPLELSRSERRDLFQPDPLTVLAIQVRDAARQPSLFARTASAFPDLTYYDADILLTLRHAALYGSFPLAKLCLTVRDEAEILHIQALDSPWDIDPEPAPLRVMQWELDRDPRHDRPENLRVRAGRNTYCFPLEPRRPLLVSLGAVLRRHDPDLLLTTWGDTWLLPRLLALSQELGIPLPLNRESGMEAIHRPERSYQAYGQVIYRGRQVQLVGRWHIDMYNAMMFHDYGLDGILESARVTAMPVQQAARLSPGTGISSMQIVTALRQGVLVPWHKQQNEIPKTALDLIQADQGGLVYRPLLGLHRDVIEVDFVSMYPGIMARFNISPERVFLPQTAGPQLPGVQQVPELNLWVDQETPGLVPQTLEPLLEKRITLKSKAAAMPCWDPRRALYKARASAHKWLLVTCFGYLGYKNARFGRIDAHVAVTAYSRECLLRAKEAAEDAGFEVLHLYVDGLWVRKPGCKTVQEAQPLLDEIVARTRLPIGLEGIYRWIAFLPARSNERLSVANRYFGVFQDGSLKVRGIEARRGDTPPFIAQAQMAVLEHLATARDADGLPALLPDILAFLRQHYVMLRARRVPLEQLLVTQKISRELEGYSSPSPAARAAAQLQAAGKTVRPGQPVRFVYVRGEPDVRAWDCPPPPRLESVDVDVYARLFLRACCAVLQPLGIEPARLNTWLVDQAYPLRLPERTDRGWVGPAIELASIRGTG